MDSQCHNQKQNNHKRQKHNNKTEDYICPCNYKFNPDMEPPLILSPLNGQVISESCINIKGRATPCNSVRITINQSCFCTTAAEDGYFNIKINLSSIGTYIIRAEQLDCNNCTSCPAEIVIISQSPSICFPPDIPTILTPEDGSIITDSQPMISGIAEPGNQVEVCIEGNCIITIADENGLFSVQFEPPLENGLHTITVTQTNNCGRTSAAAISTFTIEQPCPIPLAPVIISPEEGQTITSPFTVIGTAEPGNFVQVCTNMSCEGTTADGNGTFAVTFTEGFPTGTYVISASQINICGETSDSASITVDIIAACPIPEAPVILIPEDGQTVNELQPFILGTAEPGSTVQVCVDLVCVSTVATENGDFSVQSPIILTNGIHTVTATQTNTCGNVSDETSNTFNVLIEPSELSIVAIERGQSFRTIDADIAIGPLTENLTVYYVLLAPGLPVPTANEIINYNDATTLINGTAARGQFTVPASSGGTTISVVLPGRQVPNPLPLETGVVDGIRYILYIVGVTEVSMTQTNESYSPDSAIGMPFDSGNGTISDPFIVRELTPAELAQYPDLLAGHPFNRTGVDETAQELDNIEGMRVLYDENIQNGIENSLSLVYNISGNFDLSNYAEAYDGNGWRPIGNIDSTHFDPMLSPHIFTGTLNGDASISNISNLSLTPQASDERWVQYVGFIGYAQSASVTNISFNTVNIEPIPSIGVGTLRVGTCSGYAKDTVFDTITAINQTITLDFTTTAQVRAGSIAGEFVSSTALNITVEGSTYTDTGSTYAFVGGIAGRAYNDELPILIQNCNISSITVTNFTGSGLYFGGVLGYLNATQVSTIDTISVAEITANNFVMNAGCIVGMIYVNAQVNLTNQTITDFSLLSTGSGWFTGGGTGTISSNNELNISNIQISSGQVSTVYGSGGLNGQISIYEGSRIEISEVTVLANITTLNSYAGGILGEVYRETPSFFYMHDCTVLAGTMVLGQGYDNGGLIGDFFHNFSSFLTYAFVQRCTSAATVTSIGVNSGGFSGYASFVALSECTFSGSITGFTRVGGLIGDGTYNYIGDCTCTGSVSGVNTVGGISGYELAGNTTILPTVNPPFIAEQSVVERSSMRGTITVIPGGDTFGGFMGIDGGMIIRQCFSTADIDAQGVNNVGAFVGISRLGVLNRVGSITDCYATGTVTDGGTGIGGFSGNNGANINRCYGSGSSITGVTQVGGIAGILNNISSITATISNCFALEDLVSANTTVAARIANISTGSLLNNYALDTLVLMKSGSPAVPLVNTNGRDGGTVTLAQLEATMISAGWSDIVWNFGTIASLGRPTLVLNPE